MQDTFPHKIVTDIVHNRGDKSNSHFMGLFYRKNQDGTTKGAQTCTHSLSLIA